VNRFFDRAYGHWGNFASPSGDVAGVVGTGERHARRIVAALVKRGVLVSDSPRAPLRLVFPAALASRWMPGLFPEKVGDAEERR
jgi:hypothetical protein